MNISEDFKVNKTVLDIKAVDLDLNAKLEYSLTTESLNNSILIEAFDEYNRPVNNSMVKV